MSREPNVAKGELFGTENTLDLGNEAISDTRTMDISDNKPDKMCFLLYLWNWNRKAYSKKWNIFLITNQHININRHWCQLLVCLQYMLGVWFVCTHHLALIAEFIWEGFRDLIEKELGFTGDSTEDYITGPMMDRMRLTHEGFNLLFINFNIPVCLLFLTEILYTACLLKCSII